MPIRFRCAYCNQLMGIARRKAGTVVRCPTCSGQVVVPHPEPVPAQQPLQQTGGVFEHTDFDQVLQRPDGPGVGPHTASSGQMPNVDVDPVPFPDVAQSASSGAFFSTGKIILLCVIMFLLLGLAFLAGLLVGRSSV